MIQISKKVFLIFVIMLVVLFFNQEIYATDEYTISTGEELKAFAQEVNNGNSFLGKTVYLTADINLNGDENNQWTPIGTSDSCSFEGTFEGNGHIISGLYMNNSESHYQSLFGCNKGIIQNIAVHGTITSPSINSRVAGICSNNLGKISQCYNNVNLTSSNSINIGGIVAWNRHYRYLWICRKLL